MDCIINISGSNPEYKFDTCSKYSVANALRIAKTFGGESIISLCRDGSIDIRWPCREYGFDALINVDDNEVDCFIWSELAGSIKASGMKPPDKAFMTDDCHSCEFLSFFRRNYPGTFWRRLKYKVNKWLSLG